MNWQSILSLSILGAFVTTIGSLTATFLRDFIFVRSLERWRAREQLRQVYLKLRDPLLLATAELVNRVAEITLGPPVNFLEPRLFLTIPPRMVTASPDDDCHRRHKLVSTVYRLCAWLGWTELYRQEVAFLDSGQQKMNADFERHVEAIRSSLADAYLNGAEDWLSWSDSLIFREEQRAIGESMLDAQKRWVNGYSAFTERFMPPGSVPVHPWIVVATNFLSDSPVAPSGINKQDFRRVRLLLLVDHGVSLIACLNEDRVTTRLLGFQKRAKKELDQMALKPVAQPLR